MEPFRLRYKLNVSQGLAAVAVILSALLLSACEEQTVEGGPIVRPVRAVKVGEPAALARGTLPGQAKATQEVNLSFRVAGPLVSFPANIGDEVEAGDLLAQIDSRDFKVRLRNVAGQLARAKSELEATKGPPLP